MKDYTDTIDYRLINKIASPLKSESLIQTLNLIDIEAKRGKLLYLYKSYQELYGDKKLSSNILVPMVDYYFSRKNEKKKVVGLVVVNDPEDVERLAADHIKKVPNLKPYVFDSIISTTDVEHWSKQRSEYQPAFSMNNSLKPLIPISNKRAKKCVDILFELSEGLTREVEINDFFLNETHAQLQLAMFGFSDKFQEENNKEIRCTFSGKNQEYGKVIVPNLLEEVNKSNGPLSKAIKERSSEKKTKLETPGNALIFSYAGHDTTGNTLTWLIYELSKNQGLQQELYKEVQQFWDEQKDREIEYLDFKRLPFMTRCIMETLRLWTPLPNGTYRELSKDEEIMGLEGKRVLLKKGTFIQIPNFSRHLNPELWGEDVLVFNPHREFRDEELWENTVINSYNPSTKRFSPFTYGPRDCIGKNFSQIEMRLILLHLLARYRFYLTEKQEKRYIQEDMSYNSFTSGPRNINNEIMEDPTQGMYVVIEERPSSAKL